MFGDLAWVRVDVFPYSRRASNPLSGVTRRSRLAAKEIPCAHSSVHAGFWLTRFGFAAALTSIGLGAGFIRKRNLSISSSTKA